MSIEALSEFARSIWGLWMMAVFLGIALWAFWPRNRERFERDAEIPLRDDAPHGLCGRQPNGGT